MRVAPLHNHERHTHQGRNVYKQHSLQRVEMKNVGSMGYQKLSFQINT